ncbi:MAG: ThuA domain-containing protein [Novosphingobium sp.]
MRLIVRAGLTAVAVLGLASPAFARPVTDCPLRDRPFSSSSPLMDIILSPAASAALDSVVPGMTKSLPPTFASKTPPSFAAILSVKETAGMGARYARDPASVKLPDMSRIDAALAKVPVTPADRIARCARYDNDVPTFTLKPGHPSVLLFEKINGFKDTPSVNAAHAAFIALAERKGWNIVTTESGGAFNPATLRRFDAVIWNNISGDVLTLSQRRSFESYISRGGAFVGVHGTAGDFVYFWDWYVDTLIGARFAGHPMNPQFQEARVVVEAQDNPIGKVLPPEWKMTDEWYSFRTNPRATGATVIAKLDEDSYKPDGMMGQNLRMGSDHPIAWTRCVGKGRSFYSAIGHRPETYTEPHYAAMLEAAMAWAISDKRACK